VVAGDDVAGDPERDRRGTGNEAAQHRRKFRELCLPATLENVARNVPAYGYVGKYLSSISNIRDLAVLPIVRKEEMLDRPEAFRNAQQDTLFTQTTGGTSGQQLTIYRSREELEFENEFMASVFSDLEGLESGEPPDICISLVPPPIHGTPAPLVYSGPVLDLDLFDEAWLARIADVVSAPWRFLDREPSRAVLVGMEPHLRILTTVLLEAGYDFTRSAVAAIVSTGNVISGFRKAWYEDAWGLKIQNRYSMSEIAAGASTCGDCGRMHPDTHLVAEVVDPLTLEPVQRGIGVLVFTTLYPFVQKQPLIRYWSGDVAEVHAGECAMDDLGFDFKGRLTHCLIAPGGQRARPVLLGTDVLEIVDPIPDVARSTKFARLPGVRDATMLGSPKCRIQFGSAGRQSPVEVDIELRYSPVAYPERARTLTMLVRDGILDSSAVLREGLASGEFLLNVRTLPPGELTEFRPGTIDG
jgi:hypothetical protein